MILGIAGNTVREYCQVVGLQKVNGRYEVPLDLVEEWKSNPPSTRKLREERAQRPAVETLDGPPIKVHVYDNVPGLLEAREARRIRLLEAISRAGL